MENTSKPEITKKSDKLRTKIQPPLFGLNLKEIIIYPESEEDLNSKILKITMTIKAQYPELSKYLEEMPVVIPNEENPEVTLKNLNEYYDSLNSILNKYILEHPNIAK